MNRASGLKTTMAAACAVLLVAGCGGTTEGQAVSPLYDPFRAAGLPVKDGPSGIKADAPAPEGDVENTDGGKIDELALLSINDVQEYWEKHYDGELDNEFDPVTDLVSYDSTDRADNFQICGGDSYGSPNACFSFSERYMAWDRGQFIPIAQQFFGDASVAAVLGHEYGHAVQQMADLVDPRSTPGVVFEQQADCFAGNYVRWVAEGQSPRFELSTGDGLNQVLAGVVTIADPILPPGAAEYVEEGHGTALDRVSAFQIGFSGTPADCAKIDYDEIQERRGDLPLILQEDSSGDVESGNAELTEDLLQQNMDSLAKIFDGVDPPKLSFEQEDCPDAKPSPPASYCPATNTISVDLDEFEKLGKTATREDEMLISGDNTAISVLTSRYALAVQHEKGEPLDTPTAALRTACLTGYAQAQQTDSAEGDFRLSAGDFDEAVAGLLTNGLVASNVNGETVPSGFTRIIAFRSGLGGDQDLCYARFK